MAIKSIQSSLKARSEPRIKYEDDSDQEFRPRFLRGEKNPDGSFRWKYFRNSSRGFRSSKLTQREGFSRRVYVNFAYKKHFESGARERLQKHISYLTREGVGEDGESGKFFEGGDRAGGTQFSAEEVAQWLNDRHHFRMQISPENGDELELESFARELMGRMERDLGTKLTWKAVCHYNTAHPHIHILLRGVRDDGSDLVLTKKYISYRVRGLASELSTELLGPSRGTESLEKQRRSVRELGFTTLDYWILKELSGECLFVDSGSAPAGKRLSKWKALKRELILERLRFLHQRGLAKIQAGNSYEVARGLKEKLARLGRLAQAGQILATEMGEYLSNRREILDFRTPTHTHVEGKIVARGVLDDHSDYHYVLIAGTDGRSYFVPLNSFVERFNDSAQVGSIGEIRLVKRDSITKVDKLLSEFVGEVEQRNYSEAEFVLFLSKKGALPKELKIDEYLQNVSRRLRKLSRLGLVKGEGGKSFELPQDLLDRIKRHDGHG